MALGPLLIRPPLFQPSRELTQPECEDPNLGARNNLSAAALTTVHRAMWEPINLSSDNFSPANTTVTNTNGVFNLADGFDAPGIQRGNLSANGAKPPQHA
jgi:hypothetical protein